MILYGDCMWQWIGESGNGLLQRGLLGGSGGIGQVVEGPTPFDGLVVTQWLYRHLIGFLRKFCETLKLFSLGENAHFSWS